MSTALWIVAGLTALVVLYFVGGMAYLAWLIWVQPYESLREFEGAKRSVFHKGRQG